MEGLDPEIIKRIEEQKKIGGVQLDEMDVGTTIHAQTANTLYEIKVVGKDKFRVKGGRYFPEPKEVAISGSTWGGSMLKVKWLGIGMHIELPHPTKSMSIITTSPVSSLKVQGPNWKYKIP